MATSTERLDHDRGPVAHLVQVRVRSHDPIEPVDFIRAASVRWLRAQPGLAHGSWMVSRSSRTAILITTWTHQGALRAAIEPMAARRAAAVDAAKAWISEAGTYSITELEAPAAPQRDLRCWSQVLRLEALPSDGRTVDDRQLRSGVAVIAQRPGFLSASWLTQAATGNGVLLTSWDEARAIASYQQRSRRRRRELDALLGAHVSGIQCCDTIGFAPAPLQPPVLDLDEVRVVLPPRSHVAHRAAPR